MLSIKLFFKRHKRNETENPENLEKTICCRPKKIDSGILFSFLAPFLLVIHALIGAEVFNAIETANVFLTFKNESEKCLGNYNFAVTLYHVNAISTTFGIF